jgi:hypothetical protein
LSCETYINHVLQIHSWESPGAKDSNQHDPVPLSSNVIDAISTLVRPAKGTADHCQLESTNGFSYHQVLSELIYAYIICCLNIGFAVTFLTHFSQAPAQEHYTALKNVVKYLHHTKDWGLLYWHDHPVESLPAVSFEIPAIDPLLPAFPSHNLMQLVGLVNAAHATDLKTHKSVTSLVFTLTSGTIAYNPSFQPLLPPVQLKAF